MTPFLSDPDFTLYVGDVRDVLPKLPAGSVDCVATSPPFYGLRDYRTDGQIGFEATPDQWAAELVQVFHECRRVLKPSGTLWIECGDSYGAANNRNGQKSASLNDGRDDFTVRDQTKFNAGTYRAIPGLKPKDLIGAPWLLAFALRADGWYLRQSLIWNKPNCMPESVKDRCTTAHSYVFLLSKKPRYWFDSDAISEPAAWDADAAGGSKNARSVWTIPTQSYPEAHFATWPEALAERIIKAGCPEGGKILDPFMGAGTTALVARRLGRHSVGVELNEKYAALCARRLGQQSLLAEPRCPAEDRQ